MLNFVDDGIALIRNVNKYVFLEAEKELVIALEDKFLLLKQCTMVPCMIKVEIVFTILVALMVKLF